MSKSASLKPGDIFRGRQVQFNLDGGLHSYGEGWVKDCYIKSVSVVLTVPCKEFSVGDVILVDYSEIIN